MNSELPAGWTIERVRALSGDASAASLSFDRLVIVEMAGKGDYEPLRPDVILAFHELCLVRDDGEWFMGQLDDDGSVICWASYGSALAEAIRASERHPGSSVTFGTRPLGGLPEALAIRHNRAAAVWEATAVS
ncbi:hypothetical protein ACGFY6_29365 [Streptomyces sp. NPDC048387]|uniref:hypothetical protein n=1 Tax=Streptomyces sp. NPDC048387 TaxID=3365542 RepID=UPI00371CC1C3